MKAKRHTSEEIIRILREAEGSKSVLEVCREANITAVTFYRWKKKYGGMEMRDVHRLRELERENSELKKIVADQLLNIRVLEAVNAKKW